MPARVLPPLLVQGILPLPPLQPEAIPAVRRAPRSAPAVCPASSAVRLHAAQGPQGLSPLRPASLCRALEAHLLPDRRVLLNGSRQAHSSLRRRTIALFLKRGLISEQFATTLLCW